MTTEELQAGIRLLQAQVERQAEELRKVNDKILRQREFNRLLQDRCDALTRENERLSKETAKAS